MDEEALRLQMVQTQLIARGIKDSAVLAAMKVVPRHEFIPLENRKQAYDDHPCSIGEEQTISQPYMVALMSASLELSAGQRVLEIGTGSGYQTAILVQLGVSVVTIERIEDLSLKARHVLDQLGYTNIEFIIDDGSALIQNTLGMFDAIIVTAASPNMVDHFIMMLKEGGRLLMPIGNRESQILTKFRKVKGIIEKEEVCHCRFVPLIGEYGFH